MDRSAKAISEVTLQWLANCVPFNHNVVMSRDVKTKVYKSFAMLFLLVLFSSSLPPTLVFLSAVTTLLLGFLLDVHCQSLAFDQRELQ